VEAEAMAGAGAVEVLSHLSLWSNYGHTESNDANVHAALTEQPPAGGPPPVQVRDKRGEFLMGHPLVFTHAVDLLEADDCV
jgi:hypothetical protein